jgi:hypothetical protein
MESQRVDVLTADGITLRGDFFQSGGQSTFITGEAAWEFISGAVKQAEASGTRLGNKLTIQSFNCLALTRPVGFMPHISQPAAHQAVAVEPLSGPVELKREVREQAGRNVEFNALEPDHIARAAEPSGCRDFGDQPEAAATRMRWARQLAAWHTHPGGM